MNFKKLSLVATFALASTMGTAHAATLLGLLAAQV